MHSTSSPLKYEYNLWCALTNKMSWKWSGVSSGPCFKETFSFHFLETQLLIPCWQKTQTIQLQSEIIYPGGWITIGKESLCEGKRKSPIQQTPPWPLSVWDIFLTSRHMHLPNECNCMCDPRDTWLNRRTTRPTDRIMRNDSCCFKPLSFGDICYAKFENQNCLWYYFWQNQFARRRDIVWHPLYTDSKKKWYKWTHSQNLEFSQTLRTNLWLPGGRMGAGFGIDMYILYI